MALPAARRRGAGGRTLVGHVARGESVPRRAYGMHRFAPTQVLAGGRGSPTSCRHCTATILLRTGPRRGLGIVGRCDMQGPLVRMWLFGMLTAVRAGDHRGHSPDRRRRRLDPPRHPGSPGQAWAPRRRRGQGRAALLDCLQLGDKIRISLALDRPGAAVPAGRQQGRKRSGSRATSRTCATASRTPRTSSPTTGRRSRASARRLEELATD